MELSQVFVAVWPYVRWSVATGFTVVAVELLYFWGPNIRQKFLSTLPGAVIAVAGWIGFSYTLGIYFRHFAHFNATYGTLGAAIALSVWFYWTSFIILVGAEFNSGLLQEVGVGGILSKDRRRTVASKRPTKNGLAA
jgi:membrane protein